MNLNETFTVLEDGEPIGTFDTYEQAVDDIRGQAIIGRRYQVVKEFIIGEDKLPTVADTGWRDEYRGMWAEHERGNKAFLMLDDDEERVRCFDNHSNMWGVKKEALRPRPDLAPVNLTPHPAYLETLEDYENAPVNTVVACSWNESCPDFAKYTDELWAEFGCDESDKSSGLADVRRKVIYWPEEEEK